MNDFLSQEGVKKIHPDGSMSEKEWYQIYWNYFALMSGQRMQMINFYISIEVVLIGALFTLLNLENRMHWAEYTVSIAISFMSVTFYGLDMRSKFMIHRCEDLMKKIEDWYPDFKDCLPIHEINRLSYNSLNITYAEWFFVQFMTIGLFGLTCVVLLALNVI